MSFKGFSRVRFQYAVVMFCHTNSTGKRNCVTKSPCVGQILCWPCLQHRLSDDSSRIFLIQGILWLRGRIEMFPGVTALHYHCFHASLLSLVRVCGSQSNRLETAILETIFNWSRSRSQGQAFGRAGTTGEQSQGNCPRLSGFPNQRALRVYLPYHQNIKWESDRKGIIEVV